MLRGLRKAIPSIYWGESAFNGYARGRQHLQGIKKPKKRKENTFVRHTEDCHKGEESVIKFKMEVVK